jgi:hypothetical protein
LLVPVRLEVNPQTRVLKATFRSFDPLTSSLPDDVDAGFLPVNDKALHNGEGFFTYTVRPLADRVTGTEITNQGSIVFDVNAPILTPTTRHTLDVNAPTSSMLSLPTQSPSSFTVSWSGTDDAGGSGVQSYDIFVSQDGAPFTLAVSNITATSFQFTGVAGSSYSFYSVARDNVGNLESAPATGDAVTTVVVNPWVNPANAFDVDERNGVTAKCE